MRAAAILGLGCSSRDLLPFQQDAAVAWNLGLPAHSSDADVILLFGGDGTVHRHLAQLVRLRLPVLVVPAGSGNDFARALGLRTVQDSAATWDKFLASGHNTKTIDLGTIAPLQEEAAGEAPAPDTTEPSTLGRRYFCCVAGVGLDGEVARRANQLPRWLRGHGGYALSLPVALSRFASVPTTILVPDGAHSEKFAVQRSGPMLLAAFANAPAYGGGMRIAPRAQLDDGTLDICIIGDINRAKLFFLFPSVYLGRHLGINKVEYFQADRLRVETGRPLGVYADGEYVCRTPVEVGVAPGALRVIAAA